MIPRLNRHTRALPPGIHLATLQEVRERFGTTDHRKRLLQGLRRVMDVLRQAGCRRVYLDGSFVTGKPRPSDFDGCWDTAGVDDALLQQLAPSLIGSGFSAKEQKRQYSGELYPADWIETGTGMPFLDFFQHDQSGRRKGIIAIDL